MVIGQCQKTQVCGVLRGGAPTSVMCCDNEVFFSKLKIVGNKYRRLFGAHFNGDTRHTNVKFVKKKDVKTMTKWTCGFELGSGPLFVLHVSRKKRL